MALPTPDQLLAARDLCDFIDASPSPYHCVETAVGRLKAAGFTEVPEAAALPGAGAWMVRRGGTLVAWRTPERPESFLIVGAHTDSPNLRIKPNADVGRAGFRQLGVEVYGGPLLNSWMDRDLGLSGRVSVRGVGLLLLRIDRPLLRIPQLAIHLDRAINETGLLLNRQQHLSPFWMLGDDGTDSEFRRVLASELGCDPDDVVAWDVMMHPVEPSAIVGLHNEFVSAPRIDNQLSCWAGTTAMCRRAAADAPAARSGFEVLVLFDHEEVGSASDRGAAGAFLGSVLERAAAGCGLDRPAYLAALAGSMCVSVDGAHGTNPNYVDRHEPDHTIALNAGPVIKANAQLRYASDAASVAVVVDACARAGVPHQLFVNRTDLACGSTIGPLTAAALGVMTVDIGVPQLAMHSARELCGSVDPALLARLLESCFDGPIT